MRLSIITVTRNNRPGLARTAASLTAQTSRDFEWIIIDGASDDGTVDDFALYSARIVTEPDRGPYDAMNKGLALAQGEYLLFLNAGDSLAAPDTLQKIFTATEKSGADFIYGDALELQNGREFSKPARKPEISRGMFTHHQAMLYKREKIGPLRYNTDYKIAADYDFTARFLQTGATILYLPFPVCIFASGGLSQQNTKTGRDEEFLIRRRNRLCPLLSCRVIYARQYAASLLRHYCPALYWLLRS